MWWRRLGLLLVGAALGLGAAYLWPDWLPAASPSAVGIDRSEPMPGEPPVVWVDGTLEEVAEARLVIRRGEGRRLEVERFAEGATVFLAPTDGDWVELSPGQTAEVEPGAEACIETLLDGRTFFALRVFLGTSCGPGAV
jgi:hypothetical protein